MVKERLETEREYSSQVVRVLTYSVRWPQKEAGQDCLVWYVGIKAPISHQAGQVDIFGGRKQQKEEGIFEPSAAAALRELGEEANLRNILGKLEYLGSADYVIGGGERNGEGRSVDWWGGEVLALDRPFPVDPEEAKISQVVGLSSSQMLELLESGQVAVEIEGEERRLEIIEYGQLGENNPVYSEVEQRLRLWGTIEKFIKEKEEQARAVFNQSGAEGLMVDQAVKYLEGFKESDIAFMGAYLYTIFGWNGDVLMSREGQEKLGQVLRPEQGEKFAAFWQILVETERKVNNEGEMTAEKVNLFEVILERELRQAGVMNGSTNLGQMYKEASNYFKKMGEAMVAKGSVKGEDLGLDNSVKNEGWLNLYLMVRDGLLYGKVVDVKACYDAVKLIGFMFAMIRVNADYDAAVAKRDVQASKFFHENFAKTEERVMINDEWAAVREFVLAGGRKIRVVVDEAEKKTLADYTRKRISGAKPEEVKDIYRRSVVAVGEDQLAGKKAATIRLAKEFLERAADEGLFLGAKTGEKGWEFLDNNLEGERMAGDWAGSEAKKFLWIKGILFNDAGEASEVAFWAGLETVDGDNIGYIDKKADGIFYSFWRVAEILGWYYPNMIYPDSVSQVVFAGGR